MLELRTLGQQSLASREGREVRSVLAQPKRMALLAYLASPSTPPFVARETLLGMFWADRDQDHARNALRSSLHFLRRSLGPGVLIGRGEQEVGVDPRHIRCDAAEFDAALSLGDAEGALELYGGEYLPGMVVQGATAFTEWLEGERRRLNGRACDAARGLARGAEERRSFERAEAWARRTLTLDPWDEAALGYLMKALAAQGRRAEVLREYRDFCRSAAAPVVAGRVTVARGRIGRPPNPTTTGRRRDPHLPGQPWPLATRRVGTRHGPREPGIPPELLHLLGRDLPGTGHHLAARRRRHELPGFRSGPRRGEDRVRRPRGTRGPYSPALPKDGGRRHPRGRLRAPVLTSMGSHRTLPLLPTRETARSRVVSAHGPDDIARRGDTRSDVAYGLVNPSITEARISTPLQASLCVLCGLCGKSSSPQRPQRTQSTGSKGVIPPRTCW